MELISLLSLLIAGGGFFILSKVFRDFQPGNKKIQEDLKKMQEEIDALSAELIPLDREELESISYSQTDQVSKKRFTTTARGVFTTIYHEPVMAYNYKKYAGTKVQGLIFAKTRSHQFAYLIRKKGTQVVVDKNLLGTYLEEGVLQGTRRNEVLVRLRKGPENLQSILIGQREVANLAFRQAGQKNILSQRVFAFIKPDITSEETLLLLSVGMLKMVLAVIPGKT